MTKVGAAGRRWLGMAAALLAVSAGVHAADSAESRAAVNYRLNCSGCHLEDGTGRAGRVPALAGSLGRLLDVPGGREYIGRIPGVANSFMTDEELSDVLNWAVVRFDAAHVPADFRPYTAAEVGRLRQHPMSDATGRRAALMPVASSSVVPVTPMEPPAAFALCGACHPTSSGGANGIGPNLRGVVGRQAGTSPGYLYSSAMKNAPIVWGPETLDSYLASPAGMVPGNTMSYRGQPDPAARSAIIAYLGTLR